MTFHERHGDADGRILPCALCLELQIESWKKEEAAWIEERKRLVSALSRIAHDECALWWDSNRVGAHRTGMHAIQNFAADVLKPQPLPATPDCNIK